LANESVAEPRNDAAGGETGRLLPESNWSQTPLRVPIHAVIVKHNDVSRAHEGPVTGYDGCESELKRDIALRDGNGGFACLGIIDNREAFWGIFRLT